LWRLNDSDRRSASQIDRLPMTTEQSVFVVNDESTERELISTLARSMGVNVEAYQSAENFLARSDRTRTGCLVLDLWLPGMSGLELLDVMRGHGTCLPTIAISAYADVPMAVRVMQYGAVTLLEKPYRVHELRDAIRQALALDAQIRHNGARVADVQNHLASLTQNEEKVLDLIVAGNTNKRISQLLSVPLRTVESRRHGLMAKIQVDSLAELVQIVTEARLMLSVPFARAGLTSEVFPPNHYDSASQDAEPVTQAALGAGNGFKSSK
jgi:FixJ family two-component response regulator